MEAKFPCASLNLVKLYRLKYIYVISHLLCSHCLVSSCTLPHHSLLCYELQDVFLLFFWYIVIHGEGQI